MVRTRVDKRVGVALIRVGVVRTRVGVVEGHLI